MSNDLVYYIRRDDLIKIGWTRRLRDRMRALHPDELLALEPGDHTLENYRHLQFQDLRVSATIGVEWFTPAPVLLDHIAEVAVTHTTPTLAELFAPTTTRAWYEPKPETGLRRLRIRAGLRQVDLAKRLGVQQTYVSAYERGTRRLDIVDLHDVLNAIGEPAADVAAMIDRLYVITAELVGDSPT
jgi:hypothetical protein